MQVCQPPAPELPSSSLAPVWVLLCSVKDPGNLGSIIRTCYYLGVSRLVMTGSRCQLSSVVSKSSAGTLEIFPVFSVRDSRTWVRGLQGEGWRVEMLWAEASDWNECTCVWFSTQHSAK